MKLLIFDIDQTLVDVLDSHRYATTKMFKELFNVEAALDEIDFLGKTLHVNAVDLGKLHGISKEEIDKNMDKMQELYITYFDEGLPEDCSTYVLPGVFKLLEALNSKDYFLAVVTGNNHGLAEDILKRAKLRDYFHVLITGDMNDKREELVQKAILAAEKIVGKKFDEIVIFGDSVEDIESGKPFKAKTIVVCTGLHTKETLQEHQPSYIFEDLSHTEKVLEAVKSGN